MCIRTVKVVALCAALLAVSGCWAGSKKARAAQRADHYFSAGQYDNARVEYLNLLRLDPRNPMPYQRLGLIWFEEGVPLRAAPFLLRACELAPDDVAARSKLALVFMLVHQPAEARKHSLLVLKKDPTNTDAILLMVDTIETKEQVAETQQLLQTFPHDSATYHLAAAIFDLHTGNANAASDEFARALAADSKSVRVHGALAQLYLARNDRDRARNELKAAAELSPPRSLERVKYAEFEAQNGHIAEAKAAVQKITVQTPDFLPAWRVLAEIALAEKKYDDALAALENVFSRDSDNPDARLVQAQTWLAKGDAAKAISVLENLDHKYPNNAFVKFRLANAYVENNNPGQAAVSLDQAISINPDYTDAFVMRAQLNLRSGKLQAVVNDMDELRKRHPGVPQALILLAQAYQGLNRYDDAAAILREQIAARPGSAGDHFLLGLILRRQNKNDEARQEFEKTTELAPDNWRGLEQIVEIELAEKNYDAAVARAQQQLNKQPNSAASHFLLAKGFAAERDWSRAEAELQKAIELDAGFNPAYDALVSVYVAGGRLPDAVREMETLVAKDPTNPAKLLVAALLEQRMKQDAKAADIYEKLLAVNPEFLPALNNLACIYAEQVSKLDRAYELAQKARTLQPKEALIADTLGWVIYKRGDYQQALPLLQEAAVGLADNPEIQFHVGMASYMMGQADAAHKALQRAADSPADFPGKQEAKRRLASLQNANAETSTAAAPTRTGEPQERPSDDIIGLLRTADGLQQKGDAAKAAATYEQILKLNPKLSEPIVKLAELYAGPLHDQPKALEFAKKARQLQPNDPQIATIAGRIAFKSANFTWAYSLLQESVRKNRDDTGALSDFALAAYACGRVAEARKAMERVAGGDASKSNGDAARFLRMTALEQPSPESIAAESEIEDALKTKPDYVPALMAKAALQTQRGNGDAAVDIYSRVIELYPDFAPAQKRLAALYSTKPDRIAKAYDLAIKARKSLPNDPELARTLARISFERKEFGYAVQLFQQSATAAPLQPQDLYYLGIAQLQSRQDGEGRSALNRALKAGLSGPLADDARKRLAPQNSAQP
jgi:tetratricopeptide (TPR) repeat protein